MRRVVLYRLRVNMQAFPDRSDRTLEDAVTAEAPAMLILEREGVQEDRT